ncbi:MAG: thioredoxin domain-containing protein [Candidatus Falkowbacteria bacterium]|nr:thioredoxin domain-containing protein [Candidatus Falkowbacteria bacterium]
MEQQIKKWYQKWWGILLLIFAISLLTFAIIFGFYVFSLVKQNQMPETVSSQSTIQSIRNIAENKTNYFKGSNNPKITIVEFSDFLCPYCQESSSIIDSIVKKHNNDIKLIIRDLPIHTNSKDLALLARCAGEQNKFWPMHDLLFSNQLDQSLSIDEQIKSYITSLNLDMTKFNSCIGSKKYYSSIEKDIADAITLDIKSTPAWIINGYKAEGALTADAWEKIIQKILANVN